jgi:hypothetical protein
MDDRPKRPKATEEEKRRMAVLARDLKEAETDEEVTGNALIEAIMWANDRREKMGIPPLETTDDEYPPEVELYRKLRSRSLGRRSG